MLNIFRKNNKGVTLVELLTALAIVSVLISLSTSIFIFGNDIFAKGTSQHSEQTDLRFANDYIVKEIRYATSIDLLSSAPGTINNSDQYDYIYFDGDGIVHSAYNSGSSRIEKTVIDEILPSSSFGSELNGISQMMIISLYGQEQDQVYDLQTTISLPNVNLKKNFVEDLVNMKTIKFIVDTTLDGSATPPEEEEGGGGEGEPPQSFVTATVVINTSAMNRVFRITLDSVVMETTQGDSPYSVDYTVASNSSYPLKIENISNINHITTVFEGTFDISSLDITKEIAY